MNCNYVQSRLSVYLDGEIAGSDSLKIREHLLNCEECRTELEQLKTVSQLLSSLDPVPEPSEKMLEEILVSAAPSSRAVKIPWTGLAACALLFTAVAYSVFYRAPQQEAVKERHEAIERAITRDQLQDSGTDSFSGASFVHTTSYRPE